MMAKAQPFAGMPAGDIRAAVLSGQRPEVPLSAPRVLSEIVAACWADEPADRPSFEKVLDMLKDAAGKL
eukprot:359718-Chlamydomonas_euryale.AAC.6